MTTAFVEQWRGDFAAGSKLTVDQLLEMWNPDAETCGFVLADGFVHQMTNVHEEPLHAWRMDVDEQIAFTREHEPSSIVAIWHTHPNNASHPSDVDEDGIRHLYQQGCPWAYLIVTEHGVFEYTYDRSSV